MSEESDPSRGKDEEAAAGGPPPQQPLIYRSEDLLKGTREVWIEHGAEMYRLRLTSNDKLYLTK